MPKYIHVRIHDHEVEEDLDSPHLTCLFDYVPGEIDIVGIEKTKRARITPVGRAGKYIPGEDFVAVSGIRIDIGTTARQCCQLLILLRHTI